MTEFKKLAGLNALICEAQAIAIEVEATKIENREAELINEYPPFTKITFIRLAEETRKIAEKFRKLGCAK
jgi:regulator of protease activity HflC (stomatin/prohibitin superfamily)